MGEGRGASRALRAEEGGCFFGQGNSRAKMPVRTEFLAGLHVDPICIWHLALSSQVAPGP